MNLILLFMISGTVSGKVFNVETNEPLQADIHVESLNQTFPCDSTGAFALPQLLTGSCNLVISHIGFKKESLLVRIPEYDTVYVGIGLKPILISIKPVEVESEKQPTTSSQVITPEEMQTIPGAEKDIFRTIQTLPGVNSPSDYLGLIFVRGGELYENQVFCDGTEILSPYHYFGFGSAFNADLIQNFEFYSGILPARYGGAMSSVLDIESKKPIDAISGNLSVDLMEANWLYLCPMNKNLSFVLSSKRNYLDLLLKNLGIVQDVILPYYIDYQGKILMNSRLGSFTIGGLRSSEEANFETSFAGENLKLEIDGNSNSISTGWYKKFANNIDCQTNIFYGNINRYLYGEIPGQSGLAGYSTEEVHIEKYGCLFNSQLNYEIIHFGIGGSIGRYAFMHNGSKIDDIFYGIEIFDYSLDVDTVDNYNYIYSSQRFYVLKPFICEFGERIDWFPVIEKPVFSPRIKLIYDKKPRIYVGYGYQRQLPPLEYGLEELNSSCAKCLSVGMEHLMNQAVFGKLEIYNKIYRNLVTEHHSDSLGRYFRTDGYGNALGFEISLRKYRIGNYYGWISYAYSSSKRTSPYDSNLTITRAHRPHIFNLVFGINLKRRIEIGLKFLLATGAAYDVVIGTQWSDSPAGYGKWTPVYAPDKAYLPIYQRLDIHLEKNFSLLGFDGAFYITVLNITNHRNVQGYFYNDDYTMRKTFYMIPRVPLVGIRLKF